MKPVVWGALIGGCCWAGERREGRPAKVVGGEDKLCGVEWVVIALVLHRPGGSSGKGWRAMRVWDFPGVAHGMERMLQA